MRLCNGLVLLDLRTIKLLECDNLTTATDKMTLCVTSHGQPVVSIPGGDSVSLSGRCVFDVSVFEPVSGRVQRACLCSLCGLLTDTTAKWQPPSSDISVTTKVSLINGANSRRLFSNWIEQSEPSLINLMNTLWLNGLHGYCRLNQYFIHHLKDLNMTYSNHIPQAGPNESLALVW